MENSQPKILVFTVSAWNSKVGANSFASLLENYNNALVANICIRDEAPDSQVASRYFAISESKIIKSVLKRKIKTGSEKFVSVSSDLDTLNEHNQRYAKHKKNRSYFKLMAREMIWKLGKWKTKELNDFLDSFKPDIILHSMEGYIHLNRIINYAIERTKARAIGYIWDDNFTYKQHNGLGYKLYRSLQRKSLKKLAKKTSAFFAITEKTKKEADEFFGIDSIVLTKPLSSHPVVNYGNISKPIKMLYTGNLYIGRDKTLARLVGALRTANYSQEDFHVDVYTKSIIDPTIREEIECPLCKIHPPISQQEVLKIQKEADVLLLLEDIDGRHSKTARLSFSTKTTDYISSGRCIFAIGNADLASMQYLSENKSALVATSDSEIISIIEKINDEPSILEETAKNSASLGIKNHAKEKIEDIFYSTINEVFKK